MPDRTRSRQTHRAASAIPGMVWPAIGSDRAAHLQSLLFQLEQTQWLPPERLRDRQLVQLRALLRHARATVPHYAPTLAGLDIDALDWEGVVRLPLLSRRDLQKGFEPLTSRHPPAAHGMVRVGESSGSTGVPVRFRTTEVTQLFWEALVLREHLWQQRDFSAKLAAIRTKVPDEDVPDWGAPVASVFRTGPAASLNIRADLETQLAWLQRQNPAYLITHASNLGALADLSLARGARLPGLLQARTYSEALREGLREKVRAAWGVEIADSYSSMEAGAIAFQCEHLDGYHVQSEGLVVEVVDSEGRSCRPGETGEVVVTTLHNFAMPLIRYRIGDYAEVGEPCPCGRGLPLLRRIQGRQRNMLRLPDGRSIWPSFPEEIYTSVAPFRQFQLVQTGATTLEVRYVMDRATTAAEQTLIAQRLCVRFGAGFDIAWCRVDAIPRAANYKFEDFLSLIDHP